MKRDDDFQTMRVTRALRYPQCSDALVRGLEIPMKAHAVVNYRRSRYRVSGRGLTVEIFSGTMRRLTFRHLPSVIFGVCGRLVSLHLPITRAIRPKMDNRHRPCSTIRCLLTSCAWNDVSRTSRIFCPKIAIFPQF